jgi:cytochrome c oxidase assembly protein subunit 15
MRQTSNVMRTGSHEGYVTTDLPTGSACITRRHRNLVVAAAVMTTLLVALGGIVCATESGAGCPDWPGCFGRIVPPPQVNAVIEYTHRLVAGLTSPLILAAAWVSWRRARAIRWLVGPLTVSIGFLAAVIVFGAFAVLTGLPPVVAALDLASALITLTLVLMATVVACTRHADPTLPDRFSVSSSLARLSLLTLGAVFVLYVSGVLVAGKGSLTRCVGWPFWRLLPNDVAGWPQMARLGLAAVTALLIVTLVVRELRTHPVNAAQRRVATLAGLALLAEMAVGMIMLTSGSTMLLLMTYVAAGTVLFAALVVLTGLFGLAGQWNHSE